MPSGPSGPDDRHAGQLGKDPSRAPQHAAASAVTDPGLIEAFRWPPRPLNYGSPAWDSHRPVLLAALLQTTGPILELGVGYGSTPPLNTAARLLERHVWSYEKDRQWWATMAMLTGPYHHLVLVSSYDAIPTDQHYGLVFVDHSDGMGRRPHDIERLLACGDVFVVHDTESLTVYGWEPLNEWFRYRLDFKPRNGTPWTSLLSNVTDVSTWHIEDPTA